MTCDCDVTGTTSIIENKEGKERSREMKGERERVDREEETTSQGEFVRGSVVAQSLI
jgi:hypothetical protein